MGNVGDVAIRPTVDRSTTEHAAAAAAVATLTLTCRHREIFIIDGRWMN